MQGSGIENLLETIYGKNTVTHISSGKAIRRALRGYFLVDAALQSELTEALTSDAADRVADHLGVPRMKHEDIEEVQTLYLTMTRGDKCQEMIAESVTLCRIHELLEVLKVKLAKQSRTAKLWIQYSNYIGIVKMFIRAERTGNWQEHLAATERMLNLFTSTGHIHYARSARLYLQMMLKLDQEFPWLNKQCMENGYHSVRRTDKLWSGLWSDLVIEQTMMRSIKSQGGLTRGRGMSDSVGTLWVSTLHHCAAVHETISPVTNTIRKSSEQHVELGTARCNRDIADLKLLSDWLMKFKTFELTDGRLRSLSTALAAREQDRINCDEAEYVGRAVHDAPDYIAVSDATIQSSMKVRNLVKLSNGVVIDKDTVHIDPTLLFMRLILLVERYDDTSSFFHYELTPVPTSLFKDGFMRHPNKASLASALTSNSGIGSKRKRKTSQEDNSETSDIPSSVDIEASEKSSYVLDGGALLHRVPWNGITFNDVINQYQVYVISKYRICCVVFDGYSQHSTKDHEHLRRQQKGPSCPDIVVTENIEVHNFLTNEGNKQQLISLLVKRLKEDGHTVRECESDAGTNMVDSASELACHGKPVTVITDDTDILVLLLYFWNSKVAAIYMRSEPKKQQNLKLVNISKIAGSLNTTMRYNLLFIHAGQDVIPHLLSSTMARHQF